MVCTRAQAESGPTRLLPNHLGLPQTNELGQRTHTGRYRSSSHQEDCCLPHGTHTTDSRHQLFHHQPAASRLKSRKSFMRTVTTLDSSASSNRLQLWKDCLTDVPASVKMGLEVAESLPAGSGEDWLCCRAFNRRRTGVGRAKTVMRRWERTRRVRRQQRETLGQRRLSQYSRTKERLGLKRGRRYVLKHRSWQPTHTRRTKRAL